MREAFLECSVVHMLKHLSCRNLGFHDERHLEIVLGRQLRFDKARVRDLNFYACLAQICIHAFGQ